MLSRPATAEPALRRLRMLATIALIAFCVVIGVITFWPGPPDPDGQNALRLFLHQAHTHGLPTWITFDTIEFAANIAMFVPVGFFGALAMPAHRWLIVPAAGAASVGIESVQAVAIPLRFGTVADVIANSIGALLGYLLAAAIVAAMLRRWRREQWFAAAAAIAPPCVAPSHTGPSHTAPSHTHPVAPEPPTRRARSR